MHLLLAGHPLCTAVRLGLWRVLGSKRLSLRVPKGLKPATKRSSVELWSFGARKTKNSDRIVDVLHASARISTTVELRSPLRVSSTKLSSSLDTWYKRVWIASQKMTYQTSCNVRWVAQHHIVHLASSVMTFSTSRSIIKRHTDQSTPFRPAPASWIAQWTRLCRELSGVCLCLLVLCSTVGDTSGWSRISTTMRMPLSRPSLERRRPPFRKIGVCTLESAHSDLGHESKRAKRRRRAPPSDLQRWMTSLSARPGGLKLLLDLDNNADAVPQLEAAQASTSC